VNNFQNESLAYLLADAGYDVWFGNNRGNRYGERRKTSYILVRLPPVMIFNFFAFLFLLSAWLVGVIVGRNHTTLDPDDGTSTFWDFSWDEMASRDIPAFISLVTETTGATGIAWVGHSEGTIQMFASASETSPTEEQANALSKVKIFAALAPVAYVYNLASKVIVALAETPLLADMYAKGPYNSNLSAPMAVAVCLLLRCVHGCY
jgi:pimeloyl-ACP methyl ester carboxylesterase